MKTGYRFVLTLSAWIGAMQSTSASARCGDGLPDEFTEECDDGNGDDGDGCSSTCALECEEVGAAATDHTCLHASFGPYDTAPAQEYPPGFIFGSVDSPHTHYTVTLAGTPGTTRSAVTYWPTTRGTFAVYTKSKLPLEVFTEGLEVVPLRLEHGVSACADPSSLTWVRVFELTDEAFYYLVLGPTPETEAVVVIERLTGFATGYYLDQDGDGFGDEETGLWSWCAVPGRVEQAQDCDDQAATTYPDAPELCNGVDDDCDPESVESCEESDAGVDDAGTELEPDVGDAGADPSPDDAGASFDSGVVVDAGVVEDSGAGQEPTTPGVPAQAGEGGPDMPDARDNERPRRRGNGGCQTSRGGPGAMLWTVALLFALLARGRWMRARHVHSERQRS